MRAPRSQGRATTRLTNVRMFTASQKPCSASFCGGHFRGARKSGTAGARELAIGCCGVLVSQAWRALAANAIAALAGVGSHWFHPDVRSWPGTVPGLVG